MIPSNILRLKKCWQIENRVLVWQVDSSTKTYPSLFLHISLDPFSISFLTKKPEHLDLGHAASILRNHVTGTRLKAIWELNKSEFLITLERSNRSIYFFLNQENHELSLIEENTSILRVGPKGCFTKKKEAPDVVKISLETNSLIPLLLSKIKETAEKESTKTESISFSLFQNEVRKRLKRRERTLGKSLKREKELYSQAMTSDEVLQKAYFLQSYSFLIPEKGKISLNPEMTGLEKEIIISIDETKTLGKNIDAFFKEAKKLKRGQALHEEKVTVLTKQIERLKQAIQKLTAEAFDEVHLREILASFKMPYQKASSQKAENDEEKKAYRTYRTSRGSLMLVGKGPSENDQLTKAAKGNDFWFHIMDGTGSHIIMPFRELFLKKLTTEEKKEACILAIYYSKRRLDQQAEVYFTTRNHLKKTKNLPVGKWIVEKSESLFIKFTADELKTVLDRLI